MSENIYEKDGELGGVLRQVSIQLRGSLGNIYNALSRIAPPELRDGEGGIDQDAAVLCQSYYRILRLANNLSDAGSSVVTLLGFKLSAQAPDRGHPFGHGRLEYVSGLVVSMVILLMGVELGKTSLEKILHPEPVVFSALSAGILAVSVGVKLWMFFFNRRLGKAISSDMLKAAAVDSITDVMATTAVIVAFVISYYTGVKSRRIYGLRGSYYSGCGGA